MDPNLDTAMELECRVSPELRKKLNRVGEVLSKRYGRTATFEEALEAMAELLLDKLDPLRKAERIARRVAAKRPREEKAPKATGTREISVPSHLKLMALRRDSGQCTHRDAAKGRCQTRKKLEISPIRAGKCSGVTRLSDVTTLCPTHHRMRFERLAPPTSEA
jgi:hypothetical protein